MSPADIARNRSRVLLAFATVYTIWGSTYLAIKYAVMSIPPFVAGAGRFLVSGAVLYAIASARGAPRPTAAQVRTAAITGVLMLAFGNGAVMWSELSVPSGIAALIVAAVPLWMVLIDWLRPHGVRPRALVFVGLAIGVVGIVVLIGPSVVDGAGQLGPAALILLAGSFSWAFGSIVTRRGARPDSPLMTTALQMLAGGVAFIVLAAALGEFRGFALANVTLRSFLGWGYLVTFGSLLGFTAYIYLLGAVSPAKAGTYAYVNPVVAVFLGWLIAGEPIGARTLIAAAIILAGVAIITTTQSPTHATGEHPVPRDTAPQRTRSAA
ncbi:MAG TPA: EamA family transporter [Gemmatimonadaceae bacterium]|nr:EamA family transporter [Gemmatimonadaceae bacterium]